MGFEIEGEHGRFAMEVAVLEGEATYVRGENAIDGPIPLNQRAKVNLRGSALDAEGTLNVTDEVSVERAPSSRERWAASSSRAATVGTPA